MQKNNLIAIVFALMFLLFFPNMTSAVVSVGLKKGDWIEYNVTVIGNPPPDYNISWGRLEVTGVEGEALNMSVQTRFANGTVYPEPLVPLNLATGAIGDGFVAPTNLNLGDQFYGKYQGNITITSIQKMVVAGADRSVVSGTASPSAYYWDRQTGIMIAATSNMDGYVMETKTRATNIWQSQTYSITTDVSFALIIGVLFIILVLIFLTVYKLRKNVAY